MISGLIITVFLLLSVFFTFKYKFVQFNAFKETKKALKNNKSAYQTFLFSLASHMGTGNIIGVTTALIIGGAGSIFWMWVFAIFSSIFSLMENTIAQKFRLKIDGEYRGGASYYIFGGLNKKGIALIISIFLILSNTIFFQPLQVNTVSEAIFELTKIPKLIIFILFIIFTMLVIFRGTKKILKFTDFIVPIMSITYIGIGIVVVSINFLKIPSILTLIISDAFNLKSIAGGCFFVGIKKSLFSHEAGLGTMPTISSMAQVEKPVTQGYISTVGIFIDTIVMCSLTGFMILLYEINFSGNNNDGISLVIYVFESIFGKFGYYVAIFFLISFALATVVSQYYLGESNLIFLSFYTKKKKIGKFVYKILYMFGIFIGIFVRIDSIWKIIDIGMILLGIINIYCILKLQKVFKNELLLK